ncbi:YtzI protein [Aquibacillus halophilus]|uniref:YtzI protein n=1 Tax=Aquibacillus halophilus TaxID=930132 RepID=A0A6A8DEU2_9BACI|nr:YtzI protein [Aquibacillus halophilus]MRH43750.1 YtzI protein [Aquibacillus halophilus]
MLVVIIICALVILFVLGLSLMTINKGYNYKHTVDPIPEKGTDDENSQDKEKQED